MRHVPKALLRLGLPAVAVLALAGCADPSAPVSSATPSSPHSAIPLTTGATGSDGLTVRYLGDDGSVRTLRVEDFPR